MLLDRKDEWLAARLVGVKPPRQAEGRQPDSGAIPDR